MWHSVNSTWQYCRETILPLDSSAVIIWHRFWFPGGSPNSDHDINPRKILFRDDKLSSYFFSHPHMVWLLDDLPHSHRFNLSHSHFDSVLISLLFKAPNPSISPHSHTVWFPNSLFSILSSTTNLVYFIVTQSVLDMLRQEMDWPW